MYEFMKIEDEQHTAFPLCLLLLSGLIACSLCATLCSQRCRTPGRQRGRGTAGMPVSPSRHGEGQGLGYETSPLLFSPALQEAGSPAPWTTLTRRCLRETEIGKRGKQALQTLLAEVDSCHLPETQHSSPQHRCCGSWGLIYHFMTHHTLSWWY